MLFTKNKTESKSEDDLLVEMIHNEFRNAHLELQRIAENKLESIPSANIGKISRLQALGFNKTKEVVEGVKIIKEIELTTEQLESLKYYNREYPLQKFITEEQVKTICKKYNLVFTDVSRYKGSVPEKNLKEIENFKPKKEEKNTIIIQEFFPYSRSEPYSDIILENAEIKQHSGYWLIFKIGTDKYAFQSENGINFYGRDHDNIFGYGHIGPGRFTINPGNLKICAPISDIDMSGLELKDYRTIEKHIPDPVVLYPVKHGYLILTAWGKEAEDENVVNHINN